MTLSNLARGLRVRRIVMTVMLGKEMRVGPLE